MSDILTAAHHAFIASLQAAGICLAGWLGVCAGWGIAFRGRGW